MSVPFSEVKFTKCSIPPWLFFTFFKLYKLYQIAQGITYVTITSNTLERACSYTKDITTVLDREYSYTA